MQELAGGMTAILSENLSYKQGSACFQSRKKGSRQISKVITGVPWSQNESHKVF